MNLDKKMLQTFNASKFNYEKVGTNIYKKEKKNPKFFLNIEKDYQASIPSNRPQTTMGGSRQKKFSISNTQNLPDLKSTSVSNSMTFKNPVKNKAPNIQNVH